MRVHQLVAGVAVAALLPSFALAQRSCEQQSSNRAAGTVVGAGLGALLGGAVVGNQPSRSRADCGRAYGYYDGAGAWRASNVPRANAQGRFDREGRWVDGAPNGHYDRDGRWVRTSADTSAAGYYDSRGCWVPT